MKPDVEDVVIRRLQAREMKDLLRFYLEELNENDQYWRFFRPMAADSLKNYVDQLPFKSGAVFGLLENGRLRGAAELDVRADRTADIGIAISRTHRRSGLGRRLLEHVMARLPEVGAQRARMSYLENNVAVAALARSAGFAGERREGEVILVAREPGPQARP